MAIPTPTIPSSITTVSAVRLNPTLNNKAFYIYSGEITVDTSDTTMISVNDIGKRDILLCLEVGASFTSNNRTTTIKSNGVTIYSDENAQGAQGNGFNEIKVILPANTSLEVLLKYDSSSKTCTVAGYGYYLEAFNAQI